MSTNSNLKFLKIVRCQFIELRGYNQNRSYYKSSYKNRIYKKNQLKLRPFSHQIV